MSDWPIIRIPNAAGSLIVRDGFTIRFFLPHSHLALVQPFRAVLERFRAFAGDAFPRFHVNRDGDIDPLTADGLRDVEASLGDTPNGLVRLLDTPSAVPGFSLRYAGVNREAYLETGDAPPLSSLVLTIPSDDVRRNGVPPLRALALDLARILPPAHGYTSLALHSTGSNEAFALIRQLCFLFPGMDIAPVRQEPEIGSRIAGAYWLTFVTEAQLAALGGALPGIETQPAGNGTILLATGEEPAAGNTAAGHDLPAHRTLARTIAPLLFHRVHPFPRFTPEETRRWEDRFLV